MSQSELGKAFHCLASGKCKPDWSRARDGDGLACVPDAPDASACKTQPRINRVSLISLPSLPPLEIGVSQEAVVAMIPLAA